MAYGLKVISDFETTLFDSNVAGRGTFAFEVGTVNTLTDLDTVAGDLLLFKLPVAVSSGHAFWVQTTTTFTGTGTNATYTTQFRILRTAGSSQNITSVDYVILRDMFKGTVPTGSLYGIQVFSDTGSLVTSLDSRMYRDTLGEFDIDNFDTVPLQHGGTLLSSLDTTTYFSANPLDYTSVTNFIREFGLLFSNTTGQSFYAAFPNALSGVGVRACNRLNQSSSLSYPDALQPYFWGSFR